MITLVQALERFNRKERNLLVRAALGHSVAKPLVLCDAFREQVAAALNIPAIPMDAWWATDYHMSWLAGALALFVESETAMTRTYKNIDTNGRKIVEGNQEDVDLVIAFGRNLILIEAKAHGVFSNKQMKSKSERLKLIYNFFVQMQPSDKHSVTFHLLLHSPQEPGKLTTEWPEWATRRSGKIPWIPLQINVSDTLKVIRCDASGGLDASGCSWRLAVSN